MSTTSPRDQSALRFGAKPREQPARVPGEPLFAFTDGTRRYTCELRTHRGLGVEAQFFRDGDLLTARMLPSRQHAIIWAEETKQILAGHAEAP